MPIWIFAANSSGGITIIAEPFVCSSGISASPCGWSEIVTAAPFSLSSALNSDLVVTAEFSVDADPFSLNASLLSDIQVSTVISDAILSAQSELTSHVGDVSLIDSSTVILLESNTFDGDTSIVDSGGSTGCPHTPAIDGSIAHSTDRSKFGTSSIKTQYAGSANPYIEFEIAPSEFSLNNDFSVDLWVFLPSGGAPSIGIFEAYSSDYSTWFVAQLAYNSGLSKYYISVGARYYTGQASGWEIYLDDAVTDAWNHIELTRSGLRLYTFCNGALTDETVRNFSELTFASHPYVSTGYFYGTPTEGSAFYFDELRLSNVARHTSSFTPLTLPYSSQLTATSISGELAMASSLEATAYTGIVIPHAQHFNEPAVIVQIEPLHGFLSMIDPADIVSMDTGSGLELIDVLDSIAITAQAGSCGTLSLKEEPDAFASLPGGELALVDSVDILSFTGVAEVLATCAWKDALDVIEIEGLAGTIGDLEIVDAADLISFTGQPETIGSLSLVDAVDAISLQALGGVIAELALSEVVDRLSMTAGPEESGTLALIDLPDILQVAANNPSRFATHIIQYQKSRY